MVTIRQERGNDALGREVLLDIAYGPARFGKPSARLRDGRRAAAGLSFVAVADGCVIGTVRLWEVAAGGRDALLLGPLAVHPDFRCRGIGGALMRHALRAAARLGHGAVLLVGDIGYYRTFGFSESLSAGLWLPGLDDPRRLLGLELRSNALAGARGPITVGDRRRGVAWQRIARRRLPALVPAAA